MRDYMNCYEVQFRRPAHSTPVTCHVVTERLELAIPAARDDVAASLGTEEAVRAELFSVREVARAVFVVSRRLAP